MLSEKQKRLVEAVQMALNCGGDCSDYCCGCTADTKKYVKFVNKLLLDGRISSDILSAAQSKLLSAK